MASTDDAVPRGDTYPLGVSRPPLDLADLPTPEEVFNVPHLGRKEIIKFALGPSLIVLGISVGSGEWLLGPLAVGGGGFKGLGWVIMLSALLQVVFYNIPCSQSPGEPSYERVVQDRRGGSIYNMSQSSGELLALVVNVPRRSLGPSVLA